MIKDVKLVVCDIDDTLVSTGDRIMSERTKKAIERLHKCGIMFGLASGRNVEQLREYPQKWGIDLELDCVVGMNGEELWDNPHQKLTEYHKLSTDSIKEICSIMRPTGINLFVIYKNQMLCQWIDEMVEASVARNKMPALVAESDDMFAEEERAKICYRMPDVAKMDEVEAYLSQFDLANKDWKPVKTQYTMLEFVHKLTDKGFGLRQFCAANNIPLDSVMAFGDMTNDNELLKDAGWGVCMANGHPETKSYADDVCQWTNDEDGVARYLEEFVLPMYEK